MNTANRKMYLLDLVRLIQVLLKNIPTDTMKTGKGSRLKKSACTQEAFQNRVENKRQEDKNSYTLIP